MDNTVNGQGGESHEPFTGATKKGVMGANYGVRLAEITDGTSTTAFVVDDSHAVETAMRERGVLPSARGPAIRLAPHFYTTLEDIDVALDTLVSVLART